MSKNTFLKVSEHFWRNRASFNPEPPPREGFSNNRLHIYFSVPCEQESFKIHNSLLSNLTYRYPTYDFWWFGTLHDFEVGDGLSCRPSGETFAVIFEIENNCQLIAEIARTLDSKSQGDFPWISHESPAASHPWFWTLASKVTASVSSNFVMACGSLQQQTVTRR